MQSPSSRKTLPRNSVIWCFPLYDILCHHAIDRDFCSSHCARDTNASMAKWVRYMKSRMAIQKNLDITMTIISFHEFIFSLSSCSINVYNIFDET